MTHSNLTTPAAAAARKHSRELDGLRGLAALAVFWTHVGVEPVGGVSLPRWLLWPADGAAAVMVFFVLSGYVIGLTNSPTAEPKDVKRYLSKRLVRLVPINTAGVLLAWLAVPAAAGWPVVTNLLFLENYAPYVTLSIPIIPGNENLWSLNYEMLYYGLFIFIWLARARLTWVLATSLAVAIAGWYTNLLPLFLACYAAGFLFWVAGLALAWRARPATGAENSNWPSCVLLLLVTWKLRGLLNVLTGLPVPVFDGPVARLYYLDFLPVCVWLIALVARRTVPGLKWLKLLCVLIPIVGLTIKYSRPGYFTPLDYRMAVGAYSLALAIWNWRPSLGFFRAFAPFGTIAFALYAVARPIEAFIFGHGQWLPANYASYGLCALATLVVSLVVAWCLERRLQPRLSRLVRPARAG